MSVHTDECSFFGLDDEPDRIDSVVEDLEDSDDKSVFFKQLRLSPMEYAWLARHIDKRIEERRVDAAHLLETELKVSARITLAQATWRLKVKV